MRNVLFLSMPVNRMHHILRCFFICLFGGLMCCLSAQELRYQFKNYTPSDGLPSSEVHKVLQDARHYMWFATDHGVCRYNGYEFKTYNLSDNSILGLYEDYKKRIWAWSFSGRLFVFENEKWEEYKWNKKFLEVNNFGVVHSLYVDSDENVLIAATGPVTIKISAEGQIENLHKVSNDVRIELMKTKQDELFAFVSDYPNKKGRYTYSINFSNGGKSHLISTRFLFWGDRMKAKKLGEDVFFMVRKQMLRILSNGNYEIEENSFLTYDIEQIDDKYFFCTDNGIRIVNKNGDLLRKYFEGIPIASVKKDNEGGVWFTSLTKGVFYLNSNQAEHLSEKDELLQEKIAVLDQLNDSLLIAGSDNGSIIIVNPNNSVHRLDMGFQAINAFYKYSEDTMYVAGTITLGHTGREINFSNYKRWRFGKILGTSNFVKIGDDILQSSSRTIHHYSLKTRKILEKNYERQFRASKLFVNYKRQILVGNSEGLWEYKNGDIRRLGLKNDLLKNRVTDIAAIGDSCLLIGTRGKGLLVIFRDSVIQLTDEDGLISNSIRKILIEKDQVWLATNRGVSLLQIKSPFTLPVRSNIGVKDGLLSNEINDILIYNTKIVFASNKGISFIDRNKLSVRNHLPLPFYLASLKLKNTSVDVKDMMDIGYRNRDIVISYEALTYGNPGKINYRYRLKGYDSTWSYTNNRELQFNNLPYGKYNVQIQAKREFDEWESSASNIEFPVVCKPPFWATTWFWVGIFSLLIFLVILFFKNRIRQIRARQKQQEDLKQKINDTEQMALKAQMNPHFIFNSLNSIQQYVIDSDVEGANKFISGFSKLIRQTLEFSSKELISLDEEISYLSTYLDLEKARMESAFVYNVNVQTQHPSSQLELPPLLLQPYVENALRHGIRYLKNIDGVISLSFIEHNGFLECIIGDNGIGRKKAMELKAENPIEYQSRGMSLTAERIALLNEGKERKIEVIIEDLKDQEEHVAGTRIRVLFPV